MQDINLHSFLFSQVFGLYFVIMSIILISRAEYYKELVGKLKKPGAGVMVGASLSLFIGLFLVVTHNIWALQPRVVVTMICWLFVIKSVLWLSAPERMLKMAKKVWSGKRHYYVCIFMLILGVYMMARGFYIFMAEAGAPLPMGIIS